MSTAVREAANDYVAAELRAELGRQRISQSELARRMEVDQPWLQKRLAGVIPLRVGEVIEIANVLQIPLERFIDIAKKASETAGRAGSRINHFWFPSAPFRNVLLPGLSIRTA